MKYGKQYKLNMNCILFGRIFHLLPMGKSSYGMASCRENQKSCAHTIFSSISPEQEIFLEAHPSRYSLMKGIKGSSAMILNVVLSVFFRVHIFVGAGEYKVVNNAMIVRVFLEMDVTNSVRLKGGIVAMQIKKTLKHVTSKTVFQV
jgi:hypothetical protein